MRKKIFSPIFLILFIFMSFFPVESARGSAAWMFLSGAGATKILNMTPGKLFDSMLAETGADKNEVKNSVATYNQSRQKKQAPTVYLNFSPPNPSDGTEITATAMPAYFLNNSPNDLYYTWYLQRAQCLQGQPFDNVDLDVVPGNAACDLDDNGTINVNDYKIAAGRIIANAGFDWNRPSTAGNPGPYDSETDTNDGYEAPFGGNDQEGKNAYCYVHDWKTGNEYILPECAHLFPDDGIDALGEGDGGDPEFTMSQEKFWHTDPHNNDTAGTSFNDESNVVGRGMSGFTWNYQAGDRVGVAVEGISMEPTQMDDSSYKTMWALSKNTCTVGDFLGEWDYGDYVTDARPLGQAFDLTEEEVAAWLVEPEHTVPWLEENDITLQDPNPETATASINKVGGITTSDTIIPVDDGAGGTLDTVKWADTALIRVGGTLTVTDGVSTQTGGEVMGTSGYVAPNFTVGRDEAATTHADNEVIYGNTLTETYVVSRLVTQNDINLTLVIEDTLEITQTLTDVNGAVLSTEKSLLGPLSYEVSGNAFTMTVDDLNDCLTKNLLTPADVTEGGNKMQVSLSAIPENPMNDPAGENSDTVVVTSSAQNVLNEDFLRYEWQVYTGNSASISSEEWTGPLSKEDLVDSTQTSGIGIKTLKFKLQIPDDKFPAGDVRYLKVRLTAKETDQSGGGTVREGRASVVIQLTSSSETIQAYNGIAASASTLALGATICEKGGTTDLEKAQADQDYNICPVLKNQLIGLQYSGDAADHNFLWTVNGEPLTYSQCFFEGCNETEQNNINFFPILKDPGATYTIAMSAVNSTTGNKINLTRTFRVAVPSVKIVATEGAQPTLLGSYAGLDGTLWPDYSETDFQAVPGTNANFTFEVYPKTVPPEYIDRTKNVWQVDGIDSTNPADSSSVSVAVNKLPGEYYMVALDTLYTPTNDIKKILNANWGVGYNQFYEKQLSGTINLEMVTALPGTAGADNSKAGPPKKILAAMISGLPSYINFLFRIVLTTFLLLFGIWIILSLFPAPVINKNEN
ncbi:MAG: hypothetical protein AAB487_00165 [Patescibacteria group bacterium]